MGDSWPNKENAPINRTYNGPFAGLGLRFCGGAYIRKGSR